MQVWHEVTPREPENLPGAHSGHTPKPVVPAAEPGKQSRHVLAWTLPGTGLALPAAQPMHEALLDAPSVGL